MAFDGAPRLGRTIGRIVRLVCPACGRGRIFRLGLRRARSCSACGWRFERSEGHWMGGAETHMFLSYGASVAVALPLLLFLPLTRPLLSMLLVGHALLSLALYRWSRAAFLGIDYWIDPPRRGPGDGPGPGDADLLHCPPDPPASRRREPAEAAGSRA
jgi:uncharacterized protein (DUF983 family)